MLQRSRRRLLRRKQQVGRAREPRRVLRPQRPSIGEPKPRDVEVKVLHPWKGQPKSAANSVPIATSRILAGVTFFVSPKIDFPQISRPVVSKTPTILQGRRLLSGLLLAGRSICTNLPNLPTVTKAAEMATEVHYDLLVSLVPISAV